MTDEDPFDEGSGDDNDATPAELAEMLRSQAGMVTQSDIPPSMDVFATMEAAWLDVVENFLKDAPLRVVGDAKFIFYNGVRHAINLAIYCAGQNKLEAAIDQITKECLDYEKEAERLVQQRRLADYGDGIDGLDITSH